MIPNTQYPSYPNSGKPVYEDIINAPISPLIPSSTYNYEIITTESLLQQDLDVVYDSKIPGTVNRPVGIDTII